MQIWNLTQTYNEALESNLSLFIFLFVCIYLFIYLFIFCGVLLFCFVFFCFCSSKNVSVTYFENKPIWNKWLLHLSLKEFLHPILVSQGKLVLQVDWFCRKTGFAGKLDFLPLVNFLSLCLWWNKLLIMQKLVTIQFCDILGK